MMEEMISSQKAQMISSAKMSALGEMASGIAHEINNPLAIISGKISIIQNALPDKFTPEWLSQQLEKIDVTVTRINKIIKGLRTFARESSADSMEFFQLQKIFDDTLDLCQERFVKHGIEILVSCESELSLLCRPVEISQVLMNLLANSFDALASLEKKWIKISAETKDHCVVITFTDSGSGISHDIVDEIMKPFFTTKQVGKGTGLGLSITKGIIDSHRGNLKYNKLAQNTEFIITLPCAPKTGQN